MSQPIRIHPDNPKVFEFRGKPLALITATEHYGSVINRPFRFDLYLADAAEKKITLSRLFMLFREFQDSINPYSTCKPESPDFICPYVRTGPGVANDIQPKYDLDKWNPEFFERLHSFLSLASDYGIIIEVTLLSNTYCDKVWMFNPLNSANTINEQYEINWSEYISLRHPALFERQAAHVRKIVEETNKYDNIFYEICNEPGGANPENLDNPRPNEVDDWQIAIAKVIRETEANLPNKHMIAGQEAFTWEPWEQPSTKSFRDFPIDIVNMHPLPNTSYESTGYDMGEFMQKQLKLRAVRDFCLATYNEPKPLNYDEDNSSSQYKDFDGWTIHRKRAWTTLMSGGHYDVIDFSIINYCETGTENSRKHIRTWMKHLSEFVHSIDLSRARILTDIVTSVPEHICESVFGIAGEEYCIYLADEREIGAPGYGTPIQGTIGINLPPGDYTVSLYSPATGLYSPIVKSPGGAIALDLLPFEHDICIRIQKKE